MTEQHGPGPNPRPPVTPRGRRQPRGPANGPPRRRRETPGGRRHQARILALQILYEVDLTGHPVDEVIAHTFADQASPPVLSAHVEQLVRGVLGSLGRIDPVIAEAAPAFPVPQLPAIDRNVLRLAIYELNHATDVPFKAVINEAVELAKRFGGANSGRFVNGVLGTVVAQRQRSGDAEDETGSGDAASE